MKKIILVSGHAQHGKDTFAEILKKELESKGNRVVITHFAKHIKRILIDYYNWDGVTKDEYWRSMLQYLGTEKIRLSLNRPHFHVNRTCEEIDIIAEDFDYVIIPDTRFPNEIYFTKACFPKLVEDVRIRRSGNFNSITKEQEKHLSEISLDDFDFSHLFINSTLSDFTKQIKEFAEELDED